MSATTCDKLRSFFPKEWLPEYMFGFVRPPSEDLEWIARAIMEAVDIGASKKSLSDMFGVVSQRALPDAELKRESLSWTEERNPKCWLHFFVEEKPGFERFVFSVAGGDFDGLTFSASAPDFVQVGVDPPKGRPLGRHVQAALRKFTNDARFKIREW